MSVSGRAVVSCWVFGVICLALVGPVRGDEPQTLPLWPGGAPGALGTDPNRDVPTITVYRPGAETAPPPTGAQAEWHWWLCPPVQRRSQALVDKPPVPPAANRLPSK